MFSDENPKFTGMYEPSCAYLDATSRRAFTKERMDYPQPGFLQFGSDGTINFYASGMAGQGFEIKYECDVPCEDEKPTKWCKKQKKKGKCKKSKVWTKCAKTCNKCG